LREKARAERTPAIVPRVHVVWYVAAEQAVGSEIGVVANRGGEIAGAREPRSQRVQSLRNLALRASQDMHLGTDPGQDGNDAGSVQGAGE